MMDKTQRLAHYHHLMEIDPHLLKTFRLGQRMFFHYRESGSIIKSTYLHCLQNNIIVETSETWEMFVAGWFDAYNGAIPDVIPTHPKVRKVQNEVMPDMLIDWLQSYDNDPTELKVQINA